MGHTQTVRMKVPKEFKEWAERRRVNMEKLAREFGYKKRFPLIKALKVIGDSKSDVYIDDEIIRKLLKKK